MSRALLVVVAAGLLAPGAASAQGTELASRVDSATLRLLAPVLEAAARDSLPLRALESKVLEGVAKGASAERIGSVVTDLANELRRARSALRDRLPDAALLDGEVVAVAAAARQGVGYEVSQALWATRTAGTSLEVPVTVLGALVGRGVPVEQAASVMAHVVESGIPLLVAAQIPGKVDGAVGAGTPPPEALGVALRALGIPDPPGRGRGRGRGG